MKLTHAVLMMVGAVPAALQAGGNVQGYVIDENHAAFPPGVVTVSQCQGYLCSSDTNNPYHLTYPWQNPATVFTYDATSSGGNPVPDRSVAYCVANCGLDSSYFANTSVVLPNDGLTHDVWWRLAPLDSITLSTPTCPARVGYFYPISITMRDRFFGPVQGWRSAVTITQTDNAPLAASAFSDGVSNSLYRFSTVGTQTWTVAANGKSASFSCAVIAAPADHLALTGPTSPVMAGAQQPVVVTAYDQYGNVDTQYAGTITFSNTDPGVVNPASHTFTASDAGRYTVPGGIVWRTAGSRTLSVTGTGLASTYNTYTTSSVTVTVSQGPANHPQTVWDSSGLTALQSRTGATTTTNQAMVSTLRTMVSAYDASKPVDTQIKGWAMAKKILGTDPNVALRDATAVVAALGTFCNRTWGSDRDSAEASDLIGGAVAYDVLYQDLLAAGAEGQATINACRQKIAGAAQDLYACTTPSGCGPSGFWTSDPTNNHHAVNYSAIGLAGQALAGEESFVGLSAGTAQSWQDAAEAAMYIVKQVQNLAADGSWHEGIGYMETGLVSPLYFHLGAIRRHVNPAYVYTADKSNMLANLGEYLLRTQQPNNPHIFVMTHADWNWVRNGVAASLRWAARRFSNGYAAEAAARWDWQSRDTRPDFLSTYALEYVAYDPTVDPLSSVQALPLDNYFSDQQSVVMRSSWDYGASPGGGDSIVVGFKAGVLGGRGLHEAIRYQWSCNGLTTALNFGHDHIDDLGLWIYGKGGWQLPEHVAYKLHGVRTSSPLTYWDSSQNFDSTIWHNSLLFDNDIGQLGDDKSPTSESIVCGGSSSWFWKREASMPLRATTDDYGFARANGTALYPESLNLQSLTRTVALSREGKFVVLQDQAQVLSGSAGHTVRQIFHSLNAAGTTTSLDPQGWFRLDNATTAMPSFNGQPGSTTVLGVRVIGPSSAAVSARTPLTYTPCINFYDPAIYPDTGPRWCAKDKNGVESLDQYWSPVNDKPSFGIVEVSSGAPSTQIAFLELLWPTDSAGFADHPNVQPLGTPPEAGFSVSLPAASESWIFNTTGATPFSVGPLSLLDGAQGSIAIVRYDGSTPPIPIRMAISGQGKLLDQNGVRTLVDLGTGRSGVLEVSIDGTGIATLSGTATMRGVVFYGPTVTQVRQSPPYKVFGYTKLAFQRDPSTNLVTVGRPGLGGDGHQRWPRHGDHRVIAVRPQLQSSLPDHARTGHHGRIIGLSGIRVCGGRIQRRLQ